MPFLRKLELNFHLYNRNLSLLSIKIFQKNPYKIEEKRERSIFVSRVLLHLIRGPVGITDKEIMNKAFPFFSNS